MTLIYGKRNNLKKEKKEMPRKRRKKMMFKACEKRKANRAKIKAAGKNPDQYFRSGIYVGEKG